MTAKAPADSGIEGGPQSIVLPSGLARIACNSCRKRKVKCDRQFPNCAVCIASSIECSYPDSVRKPGPKIGSSNARRKRKHDATDEDGASDAPPSPGSDASETNKHSGRDSSATPPTKYQQDVAKNIQSLSFILHPNHDLKKSSTSRTSSMPVGAEGEIEEPVFRAACFEIGAMPPTIKALVDTFFRTFVSFRIFREATFWSTMNAQDDAVAEAVVFAVIAFALKYWSTDGPPEHRRVVHLGHLSSPKLIDRAVESAEKALKNCGDDPPPLCLVQAFALISHWHIVQGIRGRAWRFLGRAIRLAYELNLHLVDAGKNPEKLPDDSNKWLEEEAKRRLWWVMWQMDVIASTLRRCPKMIDWTQNETMLPAENTNWEAGIPQRSCFLEIRPLDRCKALQASGNQSFEAWFFVIESIMVDAQVISNPQRADQSAGAIFRRESYSLSGDKSPEAAKSEHRRECRKQLSLLSNASRYWAGLIPPTLKYHGQYLGFGANLSPGAPVALQAARRADADIYSLHLMGQMAKLMTNKYFVFRAGEHWRSPEKHKSAAESHIQQYFEAADSILDLVKQSNDQQFRYVNPCICNIIWLASAVQLMRKELFSHTETDKELVNSKFEVLKMTYDHSIGFWRDPDAPRQNIDTMAAQLQLIKKQREMQNAIAKEQQHHHKGKIQTPTSPKKQKRDTGDRPNDGERSMRSASGLVTDSQRFAGDVENRPAVAQIADTTDQRTSFIPNTGLQSPPQMSESSHTSGNQPYDVESGGGSSYRNTPNSFDPFDPAFTGFCADALAYTGTNADFGNMELAGAPYSYLDDFFSSQYSF